MGLTPLRPMNRLSEFESHYQLLAYFIEITGKKVGANLSVKTAREMTKSKWQTSIERL